MPGVRVTSVRRTVVVAVALVTGQALLGGIIGFVTFGGDGAASPAAPAAEAQFAGPPVAGPPNGSATGEPAKRPRTAGPTTRTRGPDPPRRSALVRNSATRAIIPSRSTSVPPEPPAPAPAPSTSPTDRSLLPPSPPAPVADPTLPAPVPVIDERCDEEGATGRTPDDEAVRCERGSDGELRWRPV